MAGSVLVLGAAGQVGTAVVPALLADGWRVSAAGRQVHRWPDDVRPVVVDRDDDASFVAALGDGYDLLVDCVAFTGEHARQIVGAADRLGAAVVLSSGSVSADAQGRTLDESTGVETFPELPVG
ncbi:MAG TPA: NAD-dependent epimerase/dehydratase family protein, partial [Micromonospora sp.]